LAPSKYINTFFVAFQWSIPRLVYLPNISSVNAMEVELNVITLAEEDGTIS